MSNSNEWCIISFVRMVCLLLTSQSSIFISGGCVAQQTNTACLVDISMRTNFNWKFALWLLLFGVFKVETASCLQIGKKKYQQFLSFHWLFFQETNCAFEEENVSLIESLVHGILKSSIWRNISDSDKMFDFIHESKLYASLSMWWSKIGSRRFFKNIHHQNWKTRAWWWIPWKRNQK